jgi:hypothetical protein
MPAWLEEAKSYCDFDTLNRNPDLKKSGFLFGMSLQLQL